MDALNASTTLSGAMASLQNASSTAMEASAAAVSSAVSTALDTVHIAASSSWAAFIGHGLFLTIQYSSAVIFFVIKLLGWSIPSVLLTLFSTTLTVTLNATTLMLICGALFSAVSWFIRYRYLTMYARLPPEPQRKEPDVDIFPDTHDEDGIKSSLTSYLDEFLSAIKIFGYLERPVFHELTRSMMTRKLIAGETLNLEEEKGFCIVVDGLVEIFVKSSHDGPRGSATHAQVFQSSDEEDHGRSHLRYQLLTEVRNGAPMSSLFSIMSLFTEDVNLRHEEDSADPTAPMTSHGHQRYPLSADFRQPPDIPVSYPNSPHLDASADSRASQSVQTAAAIDNDLRRVPPLTLDPSQTNGHATKRPIPRRLGTSSVHPDIVARATVDTTIAIIPASAFRRLIKIYPKATAHIVHVILSRFQRVTLATAYNYLGLTGDVLQTEKKMVKYTMCQLPNFLRGDALARLKEKFQKERERIGEDEVGKGIALHNSSAGRRRRSTTMLRKEAALHAMTKQRSTSTVASTIAPPNERASLSNAGPGDLLANVQLSRRGVPDRSTAAMMYGVSPVSTPYPFPQDVTSPLAQRGFNPFATQSRHARVSLDKREAVNEDNVFRESILECMFKAIGMNSTGTASRGPDSVEASPRLGYFDNSREPVFTNNAFGFMDPFGTSANGDAESMTSGGATAHHIPANAHMLAQDMKDELEIVFFPKGSVLVEQGERNPGLYYVVDGFLDICISTDESSGEMLKSSHKSTIEILDDEPFFPLNKTNSRTSSIPGVGANAPDARKKKKGSRRSVALIKPGGLAGYIGTVSSYRSFIDVVAKTDVYVGFLPRASLERIVDRYPIVLLTMAKRLTNILPRLILHIDFALEWLQVNAGQVIFHEGDDSEAIYIVLNGRLRLVEERQGGGINAVAEYGQGDSVGELEVLTESSRPATLHAIRDTELVKFPRSLFNSLAQEHPNITIKISKIIASRMRSLIDDPASSATKEGAGGNPVNKVNKKSSTLNLRTVAILPVTAGVPVVEFGNKLMNALAQVGTPNGATSLNQAAIMNHLGKHAFSRMGKLKLSQYLADLEEKYGLVVYVADTSVNAPWTQTCVAQADCILLVGLAEGSPQIGEYERFMLGVKSTARKVLVLLHAERYSAPGLTRSWLKNRVWINGGHHHVQMSFSQAVPIHPPTKRTGLNLKERVQTIQAEIQKYTSRKVRHTPFYSPDAPFKGDFHRLARRLCGKSVGLVLGGGGARGLAQIGIIRAMEEAGIPIDLVGGTSIGAFIGGLYARHADVVPIYGLAKKFAGRMASVWRFALDLTYPSASYTTGHEFNRGIFKTFGKAQIEDFWLEYYCNTTNISKSRSEVHTSGYAWRYVRASMSLAGLLPPLCDEGSMLVDGGYIDNLTVSHMKSLGADVIFAIDVGSLDDDTPQAFGDTLSGAWAFWNRWNPFSSTPNPPTLAEIQARLAYVSSVEALERAKTMSGCYYMRPPIDDYGTLDFGKFDEIVRVGHSFGKEFLQRLREKGQLPLVEETEAKKALRRTMAPRRASI